MNRIDVNVATGEQIVVPLSQAEQDLAAAREIVTQKSKRISEIKARLSQIDIVLRVLVKQSHKTILN